MKTKFFYLYILIMSLTMYNTAHSFDNAVPLDGFNTITFDTIGHTFSSERSYIEGFANDSFKLLPYEFTSKLDSTNKAFMYCKGYLGAENGEALLNTYEPGGSYANRDHKTLFTAIGQLPKIPLILGYKYRYIDTYSERYDSIWSNAANNNQPMLYSAEGLSHEHLGIAQYSSKTFSISSIYNWYTRWSATPYYFSPLYNTGNSLHTSVNYQHKAIKVFTKLLIDKHDLYLDHKTPTHYNDFILDAGIAADLSKSLAGIFNVQYSYLYNPEALVSVGFKKHTEVYQFGVSGALYSNNSGSFYAFGTRQFSPHVQCSVRVGNDYLREGRSYTFKEKDTLVRYNSSKTHQTNFNIHVNYQDTIFSPIKISTWYQYCNKPLLESIVKQKDTISINQVYNESEIKNTYIGTYISYQIPITVVAVNLSGSVSLPVNSTNFNYRERFRMRKYGKIDATYELPGYNKPSLSVSMLFRDKASLTYQIITPDSIRGPMFVSKREYETFSSPAFATAQFQLRIPFISPLFSSKINNPAFIFDIGPVRFNKEQRIQEHPRGNRIGPAIYASVEGYIR
jgi:hypothetical protein